MPIAASARSSALPSVSGRRLRVLSAAVAMGLGLAACGGGTQVSKFTPNKIVSFGDELSFLGEQTVQGQLIKGQKYGVNYLVTDYAYYTGTTYESDANTIVLRANESYQGAITYSVDTDGLRFIKSQASTGDPTHLLQTRTLWGCTVEGRLWMQILANGYGLGYATGCPADKAGAVTYATVGAKAADVIAQLSAHKAELTSSTLVTVLAGQNDIIEQLAIYRATPGELANIKARLKSRGEQLGQAVNGVLGSGARVLIVTPPDLGKAPGAGSDATVLTEMTQAFIDGFTGINGVLRAQRAGSRLRHDRALQGRWRHCHDLAARLHLLDHRAGQQHAGVGCFHVHPPVGQRLGAGTRWPGPCGLAGLFARHGQPFLSQPLRP